MNHSYAFYVSSEEHRTEILTKLMTRGFVFNYDHRIKTITHYHNIYNISPAASRWKYIYVGSNSECEMVMEAGVGRLLSVSFEMAVDDFLKLYESGNA